jgi:hypothetical protein
VIEIFAVNNAMNPSELCAIAPLTAKLDNAAAVKSVSNRAMVFCLSDLAGEIGFAEREQRLVVDFAVAFYCVTVLEFANRSLCERADNAVNGAGRNAFLLQRLLHTANLILVQRGRGVHIELANVGSVQTGICRQKHQRGEESESDPFHGLIL